MMLRRALVVTAGLGLTVISVSAALAASSKIPAYIAAAVADSSRPEEDRQRDADRKPAETLQFAGVKAGDHVLELIPGRGYFTRLLSKAVGPKGHVLAISPPRRPNAAPDSPDPVAATTAIAADPHYGNVSVQALRPSELTVSEPVDVVWTSQNYHDFHNVQDLDMLAFNKAIFNSLKPGGVYIVLDHAAATGSGARDTSTLHRIDPQTVKSEVEAAGFQLAGESNILHNPQDDHTGKVFDTGIRGKTDQFLFKFRKPKK